MRSYTYFFALFIAAAPAAMAIVVTPVPGNFALDGNVNDWSGWPPAMELGGPAPYTVWLAQNRKGLVVAGRVQDSKFTFARNASEFGTAGRVEVWLSLADAIDLPPPHYYEELCAYGARESVEQKACLVWVRSQVEFKTHTRKLFARMWRVPTAPDEAYAYRLMTHSLRGSATLFVFPGRQACH